MHQALCGIKRQFLSPTKSLREKEEMNTKNTMLCVNVVVEMREEGTL